MCKKVAGTIPAPMNDLSMRKPVATSRHIGCQYQSYLRVLRPESLLMYTGASPGAEANKSRSLDTLPLWRGAGLK
jgi:hypothetical protein